MGKGKLHDLGKWLKDNRYLIGYAFYFGLLGGLSNILVDVDHWFNTTGFKGWGLEGRPLHVPLAILAGCLGIYSYSCFRGWSAKLVLKRALIVLAVVAVLVGLEILWVMVLGDV